MPVESESPKQPLPTVVDKIKGSVRRNGLQIAAALEVTATAGGSVAETARFFSGSHASAADGAIAIALALWALSYAVELHPAIRAADLPKDPMDTNEQERIDKITRGRNALIKFSSVTDGLASISFAIAGALMHNFWVMGAGVMYTTAAGIRGLSIQGEDVQKPILEKGIPVTQRVKSYIKYGKEVLQRNPNALAEAITLPGLVGSCIGIATAVPAAEAVGIIGAYALASAVRAYTVGIQKTQDQREKAETSSVPAP